MRTAVRGENEMTPAIYQGEHADVFRKRGVFWLAKTPCRCGLDGSEEEIRSRSCPH
jgi:hypothetical protein